MLVQFRLVMLILLAVRLQPKRIHQPPQLRVKALIQIREHQKQMQVRRSIQIVKQPPALQLEVQQKTKFRDRNEEVYL